MLKQIKVAVKTLNGQCDTLCTECATVRAVTQRVMTANLSGIIYGSVVPRALDGQAIWTEGCQCYVNFEYDDDQVAGGVILRPCDICLVCGCVVDLIDRISLGTGWQGFDAVIAPISQSFTGLVVDQALYNADGGNVFLKVDMRATIVGGVTASVLLDPPVLGLPDSVQSSYICQGVVNGVAQALNWRYDQGTGKIAVFMPDAAGADIPAGVFEFHINSFYRRAP